MKTFVSTMKKMYKPGFGPGFSKTLLLLFVMVSLLNAGCRKDIQEPKHKNKGKNVIYLKIDEQEFLIKEGFSLNRNVIRADIGGNFEREIPSYYEYVDFGETVGSLSFNFQPTKSNSEISSGSFDIDFTLSGKQAYNLVNGINLPFYSSKHKKRIMLRAYKDSKGGSNWLKPIVNIEENNYEKKQIIGTYSLNYQDESDSTLTGKLYVYFNLEYDK